MTEGCSPNEDDSQESESTKSALGNAGNRPDKNTEYPLDDERMSAVADIHIAEYQVLRKEIDLYHRQQKRIMNFMIIILTTLIGVIGSRLVTTEVQLQNIVFAFLLFPFVFTLLAMLYSDRTIRIIRIADYIHNYLRHNVEQISGEKVWQWEVYKSHTSIFDRRVALIFDRSRWVVFVLPSLLAVGSYIWIVDNPWQPVELMMYSVNIILIASTIATMFLTEETTGIDVRPSMELAEKEQQDLQQAGDNN